jgi:ribokinase
VNFLNQFNTSDKRLNEIIIVGSLNMDLNTEVCCLPVKGESVIANKFYTSPGGKGANQAIAAARLGAGVSMIGCVGRDNNGQALLKNLADNNIDTTSIHSVSEVATGFAIITINNFAENTIVIFPGANDICSLKDIEQAEELFLKAKVMVTQLEIPLETVNSALQFAKKHNVTTILNPAPFRRLSSAILANVDLLIPNAVEAANLCGLSITDIDSAMQAADAIQKMGVIRTAITLGKEGAIFAGPEGKFHMPAFKVEAVDTTGAGDAFIGAFASSWAKRLSIERCLSYGCAAGALASLKVGAQSALPNVAEIEAFLKQN